MHITHGSQPDTDGEDTSTSSEAPEDVVLIYWNVTWSVELNEDKLGVTYTNDGEKV